MPLSYGSVPLPLSNLAFIDSDTKDEWDLLPQGLRTATNDLAAACARGGDVIPLVTSIFRKSPSHGLLLAIDVGFRFRSGQHPLLEQKSLRLTDKALVLGVLKILFPDAYLRELDVCVGVENDHIHFDCVGAPGLGIFDNPRLEYLNERALLVDPVVRANYPRPLGQLIRF
jgi:hypothetical protein